MLAAAWASLIAVTASVSLPGTARADCFLNGSTITCLPPGTGGYQNSTGDDFTLNVQSGATAVDNGLAAIVLRDRNSITNNGTLSAGDNAAGIYVNDGNTILNNGTITAGANGAGVSGGDRNAVTNTGHITVGDGFSGYGIAVGIDSTVVNSGTISVGQGATAIAADANASLPTANSITNSGSIIVGDSGIGILTTDNHRVLNTGTITVGAAGIGVRFSGDGNILNNYGTVRVTGSGVTVDSCNCTTGNAFNNMSGGTLDGRLSIDGTGNSLINYGLLTVTDAATPLGYPTFLLANTNLAGAGNTFTQTSTGTLALRMDNTGLIDNLSADVIVPGGTVKIVIQPQLYSSQTLSGTAIGLTVYGTSLGNIRAPFEHYVSSSPFFTVTPLYDSSDPTNYQAINFQLDRIPFGSVPGATDNQRAVGNVLEPGYSTSLTGSLATFYANLLSVTSLSALDQLSGAGTAAAQGAAFGAGGLFNDAMIQQGLAWLNGGSGDGGFGAPLGYAAAEKPKNAAGSDAFAAMQPRRAPPPKWRAWALGFGSSRTVYGDSGLGTADQSTQSAGGSFGVERTFGPDLLVGLAAGGSGSHFSVSSLSTSGNIDGGHIGGYLAKRWDDVYAVATINYARLDNTTDRTIAGIGATENAHGHFASDQIGGRFELGWKRRIAGYRVTPFVAVEPAALWQQAYTESATTAGGGAGTLGLSYAAHETTSLPTFVGAQLDTQYVVGEQTVRPFLRAAWVHEFMRERQIEASFVSIPAASFTVDGTRPAGDAARISGGLTWTIDASKAVFARVDSEFSGSGTMVAGTAGARIIW